MKDKKKAAPDTVGEKQSVGQFVERAREALKKFVADRKQKKIDSGEAELPVFRVGTNKKGVVALWVVMIASLSFGIYKNFTAIDKETVHERVVVEPEVSDTNDLESFVERFAYIYHAWDTSQESKNDRQVVLRTYMTDTLAGLNTSVVTSDCPTTSSVVGVRISDVRDLGDGYYQVRYMVRQNIFASGSSDVAFVSRNDLPMVATSQQDEISVDDFEGTQTGETAGDLATEMPEETTEADDTVTTTNISYGDAVTIKTSTETEADGTVTTVTLRESYYRVDVYRDNAGGMIVVTSPTSCGVPGKADYSEKEYQTDGTVDVAAMTEIEDFLGTFFGMYPSATEKELAYYAVPGTMDVIGADYVYDGLYNAAYYKENDQIKAHVFVKYLDQVAKVTEYAEYTLTLEKGDNWRIVDAK